MDNASFSPQSTQSTQRLNSITHTIIGAAVEVHRHMGPGLLESAYKACLVFELRERGLEAVTEVPLPVIYKGQQLDVGYRLDLVVESCVILELKSIERFERVHIAQLLSYLRLGKCPLGLLINFNVPILVEGVRRIANALPKE
jgi:GxxExxY protein